MRALTVTIDWIMMILVAITLIWLIVALIKHNKKMTKRAGIAFIICFILLVIAFRIAIMVPES